jgi:hypothetical protein
MPKPRPRAATKAQPKNDSPIEEARGVSDFVRMRLVASSAGRCEFRGCNRDLLQHPVTGTPGNFAEAAHIVAFKVAGPRGGGPRPADINSFENLMLLCGDCHHLIDNADKGSYCVELLKEHKLEHEERIYVLTALGPEQRTTVIQVRGTIGGQPVDIPGTDIEAALRPRYPARLPGVLVDLTSIQRENPSFFDLARDQIRRELRPALRAELESKRVQHYSVLALAPIPVLVCLGRELGNKVNVDLFQRQRDPARGWRWYEDGPIVDFELRTLRVGNSPDCVGLLLSISGRIDLGSLPPEVDSRFTLYEIVPRGAEPSVELLRRREDLLVFRTTYRAALASICSQHGQLQTLHFFPAVPAPIAVACGQEIMPKAHPALRVFDNVKGRFAEAVTVNTETEL